MNYPSTRRKDTPDTRLPERFDDYEVHGVKQYADSQGPWCEQVSDDEADFWSLYGHIPGQGLECIGDFVSRTLAEEVYTRITGRMYNGGRRV